MIPKQEMRKLLERLAKRFDQRADDLERRRLSEEAAYFIQAMYRDLAADFREEKEKL
jgi:hypothetical protein